MSEQAARELLVRSAEVMRTAADVCATDCAAAAVLLADVLRGGGGVWLCGNGGSAADAQHWAGELVGRFRIQGRPALRAAALNTDGGLLTCIGNDFGFDRVFARQVEGLARPGDAVVCISTSGNSANVLRAAEAARERGCRVVGVTGGDGGALRDVADVCITAPADDTQNIQEVHQAVGHVLCDLVEAALPEGPPEP